MQMFYALCNNKPIKRNIFHSAYVDYKIMPLFKDITDPQMISLNSVYNILLELCNMKYEYHNQMTFSENQ